MPSFDSVWMTPARAASAYPSAPRRTVDVAVVGGGILGLATALRLARLGKSVQVLEAQRIGEGASGLNGGQVIPGLKYDPDWLVRHFGDEAGERLVAFAGSTADQVFDLIEKESLAVPHVRKGWIQAAHTGTALANARERDRQWRGRGADVTLIDAAGMARLTGAEGYLGGWLDRRAGVIDPLAYTLELARIVSGAGVHISEGARVTRLEKAAGVWVLTTATGNEVRAPDVVVATNAYTDRLVPGLAQTLVPLHSFQIATTVLPDDLAGAILPEGQAVSDSRRILVYYRKSHDGRFMLGGRGRMSLPKSAADWAHLERAMLRLYPALASVSIEKRWFGRVVVTPDHLPHLHEPEPGLIAAVGCQGRGIGLMTALGPRIAEYLVSGDRDKLPFPLSRISPIPFHGFRQVGVAAAIAWYRLADAFER